MAKNNQTAHDHEQLEAETSAAIAAQIGKLESQRANVVEARATDFETNGFRSAPSAPDPDALVTRQRAKELLNGSAAALAELPQRSGGDGLRRELEAIDLALAALRHQRTKKIAIEGIQWREKNLEAWKSLCRSIILARVRLGALESAARAFRKGAPATAAAGLPLSGDCGGAVSALADNAVYAFDRLLNEALRLQIISRRDIEQAGKP